MSVSSAFTCTLTTDMQPLTLCSTCAAYVEDGGSYLGLCAGAYYACSYVEFDLGTR